MYPNRTDPNRSKVKTGASMIINTIRVYGAYENNIVSIFSDFLDCMNCLGLRLALFFCSAFVFVFLG